MSEIIRVYRQKVPALRFIGKKYGDADRGADGGFGAQWDEWWRNGWFDRLEALGGGNAGMFEDGDATIGLMRWKDGEPFQYWIGMFLAPETPPPQGFDRVDFDEAELGVAWIRGTQDDIFCQEGRCAQACEQAGQRIADDGTGAYWVFERYVCPRFTQPDAEGKITLDICHFIRK